MALAVSRRRQRHNSQQFSWNRITSHLMRWTSHLNVWGFALGVLARAGLALGQHQAPASEGERLAPKTFASASAAEFPRAPASDGAAAAHDLRAAPEAPSAAPLNTQAPSDVPPLKAPGSEVPLSPAKPSHASAPRSPVAELIASQPDWACDYRAHAMTEKHVIVACNDGLLLTLARTTTGVQLVGRRQLNGKIKDFYEQGGSVWVRVVAETAESVVDGKLLATDGVEATNVVPAATPDTEPKAPAIAGVVSRVTEREAVVDLPEGHGVGEGDRLALSKATGEQDPFLIDEPVVGKVVRVMGNQVLVKLGFNESVDVGYAAQRTTEKETASRRSPPRAYDVWELRAVLRPVLNIGSVGGGLSGELAASQRTEHFRFGVNLAPLAFMGASGQETLFAGGGYVFGAVDHAVYSAGVGVGANTVNDTDSESDAGSGLSIVQLLRLGAVDGLHFESRVEAVIFRSEVLFGYLQLEGQFAVADTTWLLVRGGGGSIGYGFGEVVVRNLLWGSGGAGSTFMELGLGGAGMFQETCPPTPPVVGIDGVPACTNTEVGGPMFTAGMHWRL